MGWKRIGKYSYYYQSQRENGRVVSKYYGRGELGSLVSQISRIDRLHNEQRRAEQKAEHEAAEQEERAIRDWFDSIETVAKGAMLAAGFHKHHGQWRRTRHGDSDRGDRTEAPGEAGLG